KVPYRDAVLRFADYMTFEGTLARTPLTHDWIETHSNKAYRRPPDPFIDVLSGDDVAYRILACEKVSTKRLCFRHHFGIVPAGWVWPPCTRDAVYWWRTILWRHCIKQILTLNDTGDFHANDLLRFAKLHRLFELTGRDLRVPAYVAACIRASLLQFK